MTRQFLLYATTAQPHYCDRHKAARMTPKAICS